MGCWGSGSVRLALALGASSLVLAACGLRVPHSEVVAQTGPQAETVAAELPAGTAPALAGPAAEGEVTPADAPGGAPAVAATLGAPVTAPPDATGQVPGDAAPVTTAAPQGSGNTAPRGQQAGSRVASASARPTATISADHSPIIVGLDGTMSGASSIGMNSKLTVLAWAKWVNGNGGIAGHPVQVFVTDNGGDSNRMLVDAQTLVEQDHAIALIEGAASDESVYRSFVEQKRIPVIGGYQLTETPWQSPMFFPGGTESMATIRAYVVDAHTFAHRQTFAVLYCAETPSCRTDADTAAAYATKVGMKVAFESEASVATPDFTTQCLQARQAGVDAFFILEDAATVSRISTNCSDQGYTPTYLGDGDTALQSQPQVQGMYAESTAFDWHASATPAEQSYQAVMAANGIKPDRTSAVTWAGGEELRAALQSATGPVTSQTILDGLWQFKNQTLGGLVPSPGMTFTKDAPATPNYCFIPMVLQSNLWQAAGPATCAAP